MLTRYERLGASSRVRFLQFLPALEREGFSFDVQPLLDNAYVASLYGGPRVGAGSIVRAYWRRLSALRRRLRYDLVWLEKEALPWLPTWLEIARLEGLPYVVDYDDAWFHRYENHWSSPLLGHKIDAVMRVAHTVVAGNDYLARRARQAGARHVEIVPTAIDLERYRDLPEAPRDGALTVGWIGIPLNAHYLTMIEPALRAVSASAPVELQVVGAPVPAGVQGNRRDEFPMDRGHRDFTHRPVRRRRHAAARHALGARQVRLQAPAGDGGGEAGDRLAGGRQPARGTARGQRFPRGHRRRMDARPCISLPILPCASAWARRRARRSRSSTRPRS